MNPTAKIPHLPALDGLRALAVLAVLFYHADSSLLPGGFLGVEIFFVISGWLITSLLIAEREATGRVDLKNFWLRRARRLLPALGLLLVVVSAVAVIFLPDEATKIRGDAFSAAAYFNNWFQIFNHTSYFETSGRPSLLKHLWSLSVEEQFYILWPLAFAALVAVRRAAPMLLLALAAVSTFAMAALFDPDADPTRIYFGTDTRASGLLIGAAFAFICRPRAKSSDLFDAIGLPSLVGLAAAYFAFNEFSPFLYRGGFALVALTTAALIAAIARQARITTSLLSIAPLRWLGERSYGIYLWHFPVFMLTRPQLDIPFDGPALLSLRFILTLAIAEISYRMVEQPIRRATAMPAWNFYWAATAFASAVVVTALSIALLLARPPQPVLIAGETDGLARSGSPGGFATPELSEPAPVDETRETEVGRGLRPSLATAEIPDLPPAPIFPDSRVAANAGVPAPTPAKILAIGDSVMEGVSNELVHAFGTNIVVDAKQGRQPAAVLNILRELSAAGRTSDTVILHIGNNGIFREATFEKIFAEAELAGAKKIVVVNCKVPRTWEQPNNAMLAAAAQRHPNVVLLDWYAATAQRPEIFWKDGIHVKPPGAKLYASLVSEAVRPVPQLAINAL